MTTVHATFVGDEAVLSRADFERLMKLASRSEEITLKMREDDAPMLSITRLAEKSGAFDFWLEEGEAIYSAEDGEPV